MAEIWRNIPGYEGIYRVSTYGRIKRIAGGRGARESIIFYLILLVATVTHQFFYIMKADENNDWFIV